MHTSFHWSGEYTHTDPAHSDNTEQLLSRNLIQWRHGVEIAAYVRRQHYKQAASSIGQNIDPRDLPETPDNTKHQNEKQSSKCHNSQCLKCRCLLLLLLVVVLCVGLLFSWTFVGFLLPDLDMHGQNIPRNSWHLGILPYLHVCK